MDTTNRELLSLNVADEHNDASLQVINDPTHLKTSSRRARGALGITSSARGLATGFSTDFATFSFARHDEDRTVVFWGKSVKLESFEFERGCWDDMDGSKLGMAQGESLYISRPGSRAPMSEEARTFKRATKAWTKQSADPL
jgi:hypothetical protein